ncbi:MAG: right-handed parallel beta-helix repeat-containing protein [Desulfuromonadales bacterium]|nr:right-handed parallel beta-helix repeat-containing protein [Desulfuromonadales bacterium]
MIIANIDVSNFNIFAEHSSKPCADHEVSSKTGKNNTILSAENSGKIHGLVFILLGLALLAFLFAPVRSFCDEIQSNSKNVKEWGAKGDGITDDTSAIQKAIGASAGRVLYLPPGKYLVESLSLLSRSTLRGAGAESCSLVLRQRSEKSAPNLLQGIDVSNLEISGIHFYGSRQSDTDGDGQAVYVLAHAKNCENIKIHDCTFENFRGAGVVRVSGNTKAGKVLFQIKDVRIEKNRFLNNYDINPASLSHAANSIYLHSGVSNFNISDNNIDGTYNKMGISIFSNAWDGHVTRNIIENCGMHQSGVYGYGILLYSLRDTTVENITVSNNQIRKTRRMGLYLQTVNNIVISGNVIDSCDVNADDTTLPAGSIVLNMDTAAKGEVLISNNIITHTKYAGIQIYNHKGSCRVVVDGNMINGADENGKPIGACGIVLRDGAKDVQITNNNVTNCKFAGVFIYNITSPMSNLLLSKNHLTNTGIGITNNSNIKSISNIRVTDNVVNCNGSVGIQLGYVNGGLVSNNAINVTGLYGAIFTGSDISVRDNVIIGSNRGGTGIILRGENKNKHVENYKLNNISGFSTKLVVE